MEFEEMGLAEKVAVISKKDLKTMDFLVRKRKEENFEDQLNILYNYNIVGSRVMALYEKACNRDISHYNITLKILESGVFKRPEVVHNLDSENVVPFVKMENLLKIDFLSEVRDWEHFCQKLKLDFDFDKIKVRVR